MAHTNGSPVELRELFGELTDTDLCSFIHDARE
jgi:hypothetical protein